MAVASLSFDVTRIGPIRTNIFRASRAWRHWFAHLTSAILARAQPTRRLTLRLSTRKIFIFWVPLAATWLMMAVEGPFLAAIIARLPEPKFNLAAYGVAFAFAILVEAPIIMIMSASTALVEDAHSFRRLRNFTYALNGIISAVMLAVLAPPVFEFISGDLIGLPDEVERLAHCVLSCSPGRPPSDTGGSFRDC